MDAEPNPSANRHPLRFEERNPVFAEGYDSGYREFMVGTLLSKRNFIFSEPLKLWCGVSCQRAASSPATCCSPDLGYQKFTWQEVPKRQKILIFSEDRITPGYRTSTNQKIRVAALNSLTSTQVEKLCRHNIHLGFNCLIRKGTQARLNLIKLFLTPYSTQYLLPNCPNQLNTSFFNQRAQLLHIFTFGSLLPKSL